MDTISKLEVLKIIYSAAQEYDNKLNNKQFLIIYQKTAKPTKGEEDTASACVGFRGYNFLHLTGVKAHMSAPDFYKNCLRNKISLNSFDIDKSGNVERKMKALPHLSELLYGKCMIGDFINSGIQIKADYFAGDTRAVISVGFRYKKSGEPSDIPVSLYNEDVRTLTNPTHKVIAIFYKDFKDAKYTHCSFIAKDQTLENLHIPKDVIDLIDVKNKKEK